MPPEAREKRINTMPLDEQLTLVLFAPWEKRHDIICVSEQARHLVQAMPAEELFWTVKATGPEDSGLLLGLATPCQLQLFFDLDWWHKAEIRPEKTAAWLLLMLDASGQAMDVWLRWILKKDIWLMASVFSTFFTVQKRPDDMDIQEARDQLPAFTLDNVYYLAFKNQKLAPLFASLAGKILEISPGFYRDCFETMLGETVSHNLETAYRLRCGRIQDFGIPDYYDSLDIYLPIAPEEMHRMETSDFQRLPAQDQMPSFVPTLYVSGFPVLENAVINLAGSRVMERIVREITGVANKVMMADLVDMDDPASLRGALEKTFSLLNLGLDYLGEKWFLTSEEILASCVLEEIVRAGCRLLLPLLTEARNLSRKGSSAFLPYEAREQLKAACQRPAMMYDSAAASKKHITCLSQLHECITCLEEARSWCVIVEGLSPEFSAWEREIRWQETNFLAVEEFTAEAALCTAACNLAVNGKLEVKAVTGQDILSLAQVLLDSDPQETVNRIMNILAPLSESKEDSAGRQALQRLIAQSLENCLSEIRHLTAGESGRLRFLKTVLVNLQKRRRV